ncbi:uncharacterized protein LOC119085551 [Bradysia coprophila]|uniref:uncharacterized protein LOC119085551 n=1 Tax=Bradysia coprophila TaxID=38358 RepID=UPI00187DC079|nr:uncharacterized protein LOC119085551 [Bradysia coprophila]
MCKAVHIFVIATLVMMIQSGLALKCFNCDTDTNEGCAGGVTNLVAEECDFIKQKEMESQYLNPHRNFLQQISDVNFHGSNESIRMVCQKLVGTDANHKRSVVRRCQLANVGCDYAHQRTTKSIYKDVKIETCTICDDNDACNSSPINPALGAIVAIAVVTVAAFGRLRL